MLEEDARAALERMRETLIGHLAEADKLGDGLLGAKLSEVIDVINDQLSPSLR